MKLIEALEVIKRPVDADAREFKVLLACGFTPLHLHTFLSASLRLLKPASRVTVQAGIFGDLIGNIERGLAGKLDALAVVIEWSDFDPRLSVRNSGSWRVEGLRDIESAVGVAAVRIKQAIRTVSGKLPIVVCMPTLPLPPIFTTSPRQAGNIQARLQAKLAELASAISEYPAVRLLNAELLHEISPAATRFDLKSDMASGFPYTLAHASKLAEVIASLVENPPPKKGLITDLDETLWSGIVGEEGVDGVSWDLEHKSQMHGLYQQALSSLASAGVLVGVASKNDAVTVQKVFDRRDLLLSRDEVFPFEVHWSRKSESVKRILEKWNIHADAAVFIDDSPMELAEVKAAFPEIECILFHAADPQGIWDLIRHLRTTFGKSTISAEDGLRLQSLRSAAESRDIIEDSRASLDDFLRSANATMFFDLSKPAEPRAFELLNKTNQFNLNGRRYSESEWSELQSDPKSFSVLIGYEDRYGNLGKIAVMAGRLYGREIRLDSWVLSCRAFSRRIEHQCLKFLFERFEGDEIIFDYKQSSRNGPLQEFFTGLLGRAPAPGMGLSRAAFLSRAPMLYHEVKEHQNV